MLALAYRKAFHAAGVHMDRATKTEFDRIRVDFECEARKYPDLTLSVVFVDPSMLASETAFREPNHVVMLWQHMGNFSKESDIDALTKFQSGEFGLSGALLTAFGVIEGEETQRFRRMAYRAASLIPASVTRKVGLLLMENVCNPASESKPVFSSNSDPLAAWINLILVATSTFQPGRFVRSTLAVDPFAASLSVFDYMLESPNGSDADTTQTEAIPLSSRRFKVALSFPGEKRDYVRRVATHLVAKLKDVFYDEYFEAELARPDLDILLQRVYHDSTDLVVVFVCSDYERKEWCGLEWRAIRDLIKKGNGINIMPLRFDDSTIPGLYSIDGYIDLRRFSPEEAADLIIRRYESRGQTA